MHVIDEEGLRFIARGFDSGRVHRARVVEGVTADKRHAIEDGHSVRAAVHPAPPAVGAHCLSREVVDELEVDPRVVHSSPQFVLLALGDSVVVCLGVRAVSVRRINTTMMTRKKD